MNYQERIFAERSDASYRTQRELNQYNKNIIMQMKKFSPLSFFMLITCCIAFTICLFIDIKEGRFFWTYFQLSPITLMHMGANDPELVHEKHQYYRLITPMFLHGGFGHLFMNGFSFVAFLIPVEARLRNIKLYALVLFLGGMLGNCLFVAANLILGNEGIAVGASTSICSVIGFDIVYRLLGLTYMPVSKRRILITLFFLFMISMLPNVDIYGHFGSLFGGALIGLTFLEGTTYVMTKKKAKLLKALGGIGLAIYTIVLVLICI